MDVLLRAGSDRDVAPCVALWSRVIAARDGQGVAPGVLERTRAVFARPVVRFAVAGAAPAAFALTVAAEPRVALLARLCVDPSVASRGLGSALLADAVAHARAAGSARIDLDVRVTNARAIALYARAGFTAASGPRDHDGGDPVATWSLDLTRGG